MFGDFQSPRLSPDEHFWARQPIEASQLARPGGTRYIFASPGLATHRWRPLSSNVRPHRIRSATPANARVVQGGLLNGRSTNARIHGIDTRLLFIAFKRGRVLAREYEGQRYCGPPPDRRRMPCSIPVPQAAKAFSQSPSRSRWSAFACFLSTTSRQRKPTTLCWQSQQSTSRGTILAYTRPATLPH